MDMKMSAKMAAILSWPQGVKTGGSEAYNSHLSKAGVPDNKVHGANMGPTWVLSAPDGPHVGPMNLAIWGVLM